MSLDVNISEPDEFNCKELHTTLNEVAKIKGLNHYTYHVDYICGKGENYIANIFRTILTDSEDNGNNKVSVIVKTLINTVRVELYHELHEREVLAYDRVIPKYVKFQQLLELEQRIEFPECIYNVIEKSKEVLVLEDMREKGYHTDNTLANYEHLDCEQARDVVKELAKFHSLSIIYETHEPESFVQVKSDFRDIIFSKSFLNKTKLWNYFDESFGASLDLVENCEAKSKLVIIKGKLLELLRLFTRTEQYGVLCHGDFWMNNIMFKHEETNKTQACFIDFQTMRYASPTTDIFHFLYLCTDSAFRKEYSTALFNDYHNTIIWFLRLYDIDANLVYNRDRFDRQLEEFKPYGFLIAMLELKLVTLNMDENECSNDDVGGISSISSKYFDVNKYHKMMINDVVNESLGNGVLDRLIDKINDF